MTDVQCVPRSTGRAATASSSPFAAGLIRRGVTVHAGPVLGGGPAGFDDDRIAPPPCSTRLRPVLGD